MAMVPSMATVLRALSQTGRFLFVLYVIWMFLALDVVCLIVYNRQTLLEIGSTVTHRKPYFKFRISQGKAKEELYASWSKILGAIGRMHILYNIFVLLTCNTSHFCTGRFGYRGNSQRSSLQLFTSPLKPTQMQHSRNCMGIYAKQKTVHHDAAFIITGDFNKADLRRIAPKFFQHISCNTRGEQTLDHRYCGHRNAYKSFPCPPLGKSDSLLTGRTWNGKHPPSGRFSFGQNQQDSMLQGCFVYVWLG